MSRHDPLGSTVPSSWDIANAQLAAIIDTDKPVYMQRVMDLGPNTFWFLRTTAATTALDGAGVLDAFAAHLKRGDLIWAVTGSAQTAFGFMLVKDHSGTVVDLANVDVIGGTDSD